MTKEELEKYARKNRNRLDAQEVKLGDVVMLLVGSFAGETGIVVGISACRNDYADPYYEVDMNCEAPEKYKCRKTLITPNNVVGGLSAYEFEVIGNRAPIQLSHEIKVGDKVRVREDAPKILFKRSVCNFPEWVFEVRDVEDGNADIYYGAGKIPLAAFVIPTKYLVKVEEEKKEPKFKVGDVVRVKGYGYEPNLHKGDIGEILDTNDKEQCFVLFKKSQAWIYVDCLEPYTEPTEQTEAEKTNHTIKIPMEVDLTDSYWDAYAADLAKEIAVKVANKYNDPKEAGEYAVRVAEVVVAGLKRK